MSLRTSLFAGSALLLSLAVTTPALAQSSDVGVEILQLLVDEGVIPHAKAQEILTKARQADAAKRETEAAKTASTTIDVAYVPETVRAQIKAEVKQEVVAQAKSEGWVAPNTLPDWVDRIKISGDFRARFQNEDFPTSVITNGIVVEGNPPVFPNAAAINRAGGVNIADGFPLLNSTIDRRRSNYRARLKFEADINDKVSVGLRLASGNDNNPVTTNTSFGDYFSKDEIWIDQAYVNVKPIKGLTLTAGRMPNPFYATDLVWDADINLEGLAVSGDYGFNDSLKIFGTAAVLPLQEREIYDDSYLYAAQAGVGGQFASQFGYKAAVSYYDFSNVQSTVNAPNSRLTDWSAPKYLSKGNSLVNLRTDGTTFLAGLASKYELMAFTGQLTYGTGPRQYRLSGEVVKNQGHDTAELLALGLQDSGDTGYQIRFDAGYPVVSERNQWRVAAAFKHVEADAVLDVFTDSDFGLGGTDSEGYILEGEYGVYKNSSVSATWLSSDSIDGLPFSVDVLQLNFNTRF
jgi:Putative porin